MRVIAYFDSASSTLEITVQSYALIGNITFSLRIRKVPGLSAERMGLVGVILTD